MSKKGSLESYKMIRKVTYPQKAKRKADRFLGNSCQSFPIRGFVLVA